MQVAAIDTQRQYLLAVFITMCATILFSAKGVFIKFAYEYQVDVVTLLAIRMGFAVPVYLLIALFSESISSTRLSIGQGMMIAGLGCLGYYLASYLDMAGLSYISVGMERMVLYLYPTFVLLLSVIIYRQKVTRREIMALFVAYAGIALIFFHDITAGNKDILVGAGLVLLSALVFAVFMLGSHHHISAVGSLRFTAYAMSAAAGAVFVHFMFTDTSRIFQQQHEVYLWGGVLSLFSTIIPSFLLAYGTKKLGAREVSMIGVVGPVATLLYGSLFLGESMTAFQIAGMMVVLVAVTSIVFFNSRDRKKQ